jgi:hypothetical protein
MHDIVDRLRDRSFSTKARDPLCEEAATEIERLRNGAAEGCETLHCNALVGVPEMDSGADRKSVATQGSAHSCGQPFDSAPTTQVCPHVRGTVTQHCTLNFTLTDEERNAIEWYAEFVDGLHADTLRSLLQRVA